MTKQLLFVALFLLSGLQAGHAADAPAKDDAVTQEPKIIQGEEMKYVGLSTTHKPFEKGSKEIPNLWNKFIARNAEIKDKVGPTLGIAGEFDEKNGSASYIAAAQVKNVDTVPEGMVKGVVPARLYAEFKHKGPISTFKKTLDFIYGTWLPKSGYKNKGSMVEIYPKDSDVDANDFEMTVWLAIQK